MIKSLYLMLTQKCNGFCEYCYLSEEEKRKEGDDDFFRGLLGDFIEQSNSNRIPPNELQLRFIGGEPYLKYEFMMELSLRFLNSCENTLVGINTNGTLIREYALNSLQRWNRNIIHIVSLDGMEELHNSRRRLKNGMNAWWITVDGIKTLTRLGFPVYINMVLDRDSIKGMKDFLHFINDFLHMDSLSVSLLHSVDNSLDCDEKLQLLTEAYKLAAEQGVRLTGHHRLLLGHHIEGLECRAGVNSALVSSDRKCYSCQRFVGRTSDFISCGDNPKFSPEFSHDISCCYTPEVEKLATGVMRIYRDEFPEYLEVAPLDRAVFGTI